MKLSRKAVGILLVTMMVFGMAGVVSATIFNAAHTYGSGTSGQFIAKNGAPFEFFILTSGFSVPSDTINSAVLSIIGYNAYSQPGNFEVYTEAINITDMLTHTLTDGGHNGTSTTTISNGSFLNIFQDGWNKNGTLGITITAGNKDFWLDSYDLTVDYTAPLNQEPTPTPEPETMMLLVAGFLGLAIYGKRRKSA